jgi:hypothetical protein
MAQVCNALLAKRAFGLFDLPFVYPEQLEHLL